MSKKVSFISVKVRAILKYISVINQQIKFILKARRFVNLCSAMRRKILFMTLSRKKYFNSSAISGTEAKLTENFSRFLWSRSRITENRWTQLKCEKIPARGNKIVYCNWLIFRSSQFIFRQSIAWFLFKNQLGKSRQLNSMMP